MSSSAAPPEGEATPRSRGPRRTAVWRQQRAKAAASSPCTDDDDSSSDSASQPEPAPAPEPEPEPEPEPTAGGAAAPSPRIGAGVASAGSSLLVFGGMHETPSGAEEASNDCWQLSSAGEWARLC